MATDRKHGAGAVFESSQLISRHQAEGGEGREGGKEDGLGLGGSLNLKAHLQ